MLRVGMLALLMSGVLQAQDTVAGTAKPAAEYQYHYKDVTIARPSPDEAKIPFSPRLAVDYMEQGALAWTGERQCVACHTNGAYMMVRLLLIPQLGRPR